MLNKKLPLTISVQDSVGPQAYVGVGTHHIIDPTEGWQIRLDTLVVAGSRQLI